MTEAGSQEGIVILGALSAVAMEIARHHARENDRIVLVARHGDKLQSLAADLEARGAKDVTTVEKDLVQLTNYEGEFSVWRQTLGSVDRVYICYGVLGDQEEAAGDLEYAAGLLETNFVSACGWAGAAANILEEQGKGSVVAISSVAGDRGRQSNYVYGAAKGGLTIFMQGLDHRLSKVGARAVAVKMGFVISPMTDGMKRSGPLWTKPADAAAMIVKAAKKSHGAVYVPWFWRGIMAIIRLLPTFIFNKSNL